MLLSPISQPFNPFSKLSEKMTFCAWAAEAVNSIVQKITIRGNAAKHEGTSKNFIARSS
jgi:hypothetical protein